MRGFQEYANVSLRPEAVVGLQLECMLAHNFFLRVCCRPFILCFQGNIDGSD